MPGSMQAHSTRGMITSWALFKGISAEDVCSVVSWASPHTLMKFYHLDVTVQDVTQLCSQQEGDVADVILCCLLQGCFQGVLPYSHTDVLY